VTSSVVDHRFGSGPPLTIGVEEEYMLLDADGYGLANRYRELEEAVAGLAIAPNVHPELMESTVEAATPVCAGIGEARRELVALRRGIADAAATLGLVIGAAGTHPFSRSEEQRISAHDRYRELIDQLQYVARRELVFGMHVHVAVPDPETCIKVMEGVLIELPVLLALSVNSPFWRGHETGLQSTRTAVFAGFPRSGLPPRFESYEDYADSVGWMEETGAIGDYTRLWWDVRPHPRLGTIELRVADCQFDVDYAMALVAYVQALVKSLVEAVDRDHPPIAYHRMLTAENKWLAARYGLDAQLMDLAAGERVKTRASDLALRRLEELMPHARELGCDEALREVERIVSNGTGATRQLRVYRANHDLEELLREVSEVTAARDA
jgi:glutamate---cysteine ligase / carboxylate-amine ligase